MLLTSPMNQKAYSEATFDRTYRVKAASDVWLFQGGQEIERGVIDDVYRYDSGSDSWILVTKMIHPRCWHSINVLESWQDYAIDCV